MKSIVQIAAGILICVHSWSPTVDFATRPTRKKHVLFATSPSSENASPAEILRATQVFDPRTGSSCRALDDKLFARGPFDLLGKDGRALVVVMPQLGEFDSFEYAEQLVAVLPDLKEASISLRVIGIGDVQSGRRFCSFTGLPIENLRVDPTASVHEALGCHRGPNWDVPSFLPDSLLKFFAERIGLDADVDNEVAKEAARAWLNYLAMCAGIAAPGTLAEILRGYLGDKSAPERLSEEETVTAGPISITGTRDVMLGPISYQNFWKDEVGYQRPVELATVRLRNMVEVLSHLQEYVPDQSVVDWRGATFLIDSDGNTLYEYFSRGVLTYSETMDRPLTFLSDYIGEERARNPLGLGDPETT